MPSTSAQLGAAIRRLRTERELSVENLAAVAGIHWTYLSGIERERRNPSWKVLSAIAQALGVRVSQIARLAEEMADSGGSRPVPRRRRG